LKSKLSCFFFIKLSCQVSLYFRGLYFGRASDITA